MRQVISISATGCISGLQVKPGKGFDLRQLGRAAIERASEIQWCERWQAWCVFIIRGKYAGDTITREFCNRVGFSSYTEEGDDSYRKPIVFQDYDNAVKLEVDVLDHIRAIQGAEAL